MRWFGPNVNEVWHAVCGQLHGEYRDGGLWKSDQVRVRHDAWLLTLDVYTVSGEGHNEQFTRMRAPFYNQNGFRFLIRHQGVIDRVGKSLGMQDVEIGDEALDKTFVFQSKQEDQLRRLLDDAPLRTMLKAEPWARLEVKHGEGWFGPKFPPNVDELALQVRGKVEDPGRLRRMFDLLGLTLDRLAAIGAAARIDPGLEL